MDVKKAGGSGAVGRGLSGVGTGVMILEAAKKVFDLLNWGGDAVTDVFGGPGTAEKQHADLAAGNPFLSLWKTPTS